MPLALVSIGISILYIFSDSTYLCLWRIHIYCVSLLYLVQRKKHIQDGLGNCQQSAIDGMVSSLYPCDSPHGATFSKDALNILCHDSLC